MGVSDPKISAQSAADPSQQPALHRHLGLLHATALNVTMIVGAGVFAMIPQMLVQLPGPYALLPWLAAGALILVDGTIWGELGAMLPGSGGSYLYLLESYGRERWGRLMAFLFIWQFLISGPLEIASGLIAMAQFANGLDTGFAAFNEKWTWSHALYQWQGEELAISIGPARLGCMLLGVLILVLLYRRITSLGRLTIVFWIGVLAAIAWILVEGGLHFRWDRAFDFSEQASHLPAHFPLKLGAAMILAMYAYLGYYHVCYVGDEVRDPGRTIPRAVMLSALLVCLLFVALHLALMGTVSWHDVPTEKPALDNYTLPTEFMQQLHGEAAGRLMAVLLIWSCFGSAFAGLLGYSRIPYGAARYGHFFGVLARVHPRHNIPHLGLLLVGALTLFWTLFDLQSVVNALITTRILEQFIGQIVGVVLLRWRQPDRPRPFRMWFYPLPCGLALAGWLYLYISAGLPFIVLGLATMCAGVVVFFMWSWRTGGWPFDRPQKLRASQENT